MSDETTPWRQREVEEFARVVKVRGEAELARRHAATLREPMSISLVREPRRMADTVIRQPFSREP